MKVWPYTGVLPCFCWPRPCSPRFYEMYTRTSFCRYISSRQVHKQQLFLTLACLQAVESAISLQLRAIESFKPDVVVAEDFGAGIATWLLHRGLWAGPTLLLSPLHDELCRQAGLRTGSLSLPEDVPVVIVHARHDTLVSRPRHPPHTYLRAARRFRLPIVPGWPRARPI